MSIHKTLIRLIDGIEQEKMRSYFSFLPYFNSARTTTLSRVFL